MIKRLTSLWMCVSLCLVTALPIMAASDREADKTGSTALTADSPEDARLDDASITVSDGVIGFGGDVPKQIINDQETDGTTVSSIGVYPYEIRYDSHNGSPVVIKSFKVLAGYDPASLIENDFEDNGFSYTHKDILKNDPQILQDNKMVAQTVTFSTPDDDQATVMSMLTPLIEYNEGGYSGQLELDYNTIQSTVAGTESYSYPITRTVEYNNLDNNDYAYLDKELDGLTLQGADWTELGGARLPGYIATATYTGIGYGSKVTGYNNMAVYKGTVSRIYEGETTYSIVYQGTKLASDFPWAGVGVGLLLLAIIAAAVFFLVTRVLPGLGSRNRKSPPPIDVPN